MPLFQGVELRVGSGDAGTTMMIVERAQSINIPLDIPRADIKTLNRFRSDQRRPIINYVPVPLSFECIKGDNIMEKALGLANVSGAAFSFMNAKSQAGFGARNFEILLAPLNKSTYEGQFNITSGVLNSYSVNASVGDVAKTSWSFQALDIGFASNNGTKTGVDYGTSVVRGQDASFAGIDISGFGISGFAIQSFNLGINFSRTEVNQIGYKFPVDRPVVDASATIQIQGFIEGGNTSLTGLGIYDCGLPASGSLYFTLVPSCGTSPATVYRVINPYISSQNISFSVGNMSAVDMTFSVPLPVTASETGNGSNLIIS